MTVPPIPREAAGAPSVEDPLGFGIVFNTDPRGMTNNGASVTVANNGFYSRLSGKGVVTKLTVQVVNSSGNVSVALYPNSGGGRTAVPTTPRSATSGAIACPAIGYTEVSLGASTLVTHGSHWAFFSADNTTATFAKNTGTGLTAGTQMSSGLAYYQLSAHPAPTTPAPAGSAAANVFPTIGVP